MAATPQDDRMTRPQLMGWFSAFTGWLFDYYEIALLTFLVVPITQTFGLTSSQTARFISVQLLGIALGGVIFGFLGDRYGRQKILVVTIAMYGVFTLARAFAPNYTTLMLLTVLAAVGLGGEYGVGQALVSELVPASRRGWWSAMLYNGGMVGLALAAVVGGYLLPAVGWRWVFAISCAPILLAFIVRKTAPESEVWEAALDAERKQLGRPGTDWSLFAKRSFLVALLLCTVSAAIEFFAYYGVSAFLPTYLIEKQGLSFGHAAWWIMVEALAIFIGVMIGGYTADRWGRRVTWTYLSLVATVGGVVLAYFWNSAAQTLWILVPFFVFYLGTGVVGVFGSLFSEQFPTRTRSVGVSTSLQVGRGLSYFPPLIAAAVYPVHGYQPLIYGGAVLYLLLAAIVWLFKDGSGEPITAVVPDPVELGTAPAATQPSASDPSSGQVVR
jgi:MFS family permease